MLSIHCLIATSSCILVLASMQGGTSVGNGACTQVTPTCIPECSDNSDGFTPIAIIVIIAIYS